MRCGGNEREVRFKRFDVSGMPSNYRECSYLGSVSLTCTLSSDLVCERGGGHSLIDLTNGNIIYTPENPCYAIKTSIVHL